MSSFTHYQIRRFSTLFSQYASDDHRASDAHPAATKSKPRVRLGPKDLSTLMPRLGPSVSFNECQNLVRCYDTSCSGALDFEDFTQLLADLEITLKDRQRRAREMYAERRRTQLAEARTYETEAVTSARDFIGVYPTEEEYLESLNLHDPESYFTEVDGLTTELLQRGLIDDVNILRRKIVVRIFGAKGLESQTRVKVRQGSSIEYNSIDPFVRVTFAGMIQETTALVGSTTPQWEQDLSFSVFIPPGEPHEVQQWVERQNFEFALFDYVSLSQAPHVEMVACASVPLIRVLLVPHHTLSLVLRMHTLNDALQCPEPIQLEVSLTDATLERYAWSKLVDTFERPEEVWRQKYSDKMKHDLDNVCFAPASPTHAMNQSQALDVWSYYQGMTDFLNDVFPRRTFQAVALSESNNFHFLPCFLTPMRSSQIKNPVAAAEAVSMIPLAETTQPQSDLARNIILKLPNLDATTLLSQSVATDVDQVAFRMWSNARASPATATENFYRQFSSPATFIAEGHATVFEHCLLLCNLLLGLGMNAFVALGKVKLRNFAWVITIGTRQKEDILPFSELADSATRESPLYQQLQEILSANRSLEIAHWDPLTGAHFHKPSERGFVFERIEVLFNHRNIFFNIQKSGIFLRPAFSWNLQNSEHWLPFLSDGAMNRYGTFKPFYDVELPSVSPMWMAVSDLFSSDRFLVSELMRAVQGYRRHVLLAPETLFHRNLSEYLQQQLHRLESLNVSFHAAVTSSESKATRSTTGVFDEIKAGCLQRTPSGRISHVFYCHVTRFDGVDELVHDLIGTGMFDAPNATYAIAAKAFPSLWSLSLWGLAATCGWVCALSVVAMTLPTRRGSIALLVNKLEEFLRDESLRDIPFPDGVGTAEESDQLLSQSNALQRVFSSIEAVATLQRTSPGRLASIRPLFVLVSEVEETFRTDDSMDPSSLVLREAQWVFLAKCCLHAYSVALIQAMETGSTETMLADIDYWRQLEFSSTSLWLYFLQTLPLRIVRNTSLLVERIGGAFAAGSSLSLAARARAIFTALALPIAELPTASARDYANVDVLTTFTILGPLKLLVQHEVSSRRRALETLRIARQESLGALASRGLLSLKKEIQESAGIGATKSVEGSGDSVISGGVSGIEGAARGKGVLSAVRQRVHGLQGGVSDALIFMRAIFDRQSLFETALTEAADRGKSTGGVPFPDSAELSEIVSRNPIMMRLSLIEANSALRSFMQSLSVLPQKSQATSNRFQRPAVLTRYWLPGLVGFYAFYSISEGVRLRWTAIVGFFDNVVSTCEDFWRQWVVVPIQTIYQTVRNDPNAQISLLKMESLKSDLSSLERMVVDFVKDAKKGVLTADEIQEVSEMTRNGDLTPILQAYEADMKNPIRGAIQGQLLRSFLIQIQKTKVDTEVAMSALQKLLSQNELNFAVISSIPAFLFMYLVWTSIREGGKQRGVINREKAFVRFRRGLRRIEVIFTRNNNATRIEKMNHVAASLTAGMGYRDQGAILCELHWMKAYAKYLPLPSSVVEEILAEDIADLANATFSIDQKLRTVDRLWRTIGGSEK